MKWMVPDYYRDFQCIAGACKHSCCIGWEIDIDEETLAKYQNVGGSFGERLAQGIVQSNDSASFRLCDDERCPFLNDEGLCDIILNLGEEMLSQICTDHPRYRNFFADRVETGLGLCCEEAGRLILGRKHPAKWILEDEDEVCEDLPEFEREILAARDSLVEIAQDRRFPMQARMEKLLEEVEISFPERTLAKWAEFYLSLEQLDPAWGELLNTAGETVITEAVYDEIALEQLLVYFLFRHAAGAVDSFDLAARAAFAVHAVWMICGLTALRNEKDSFEALVDTARMYSSEVEYSDENLGAILDELVS